MSEFLHQLLLFYQQSPAFFLLTVALFSLLVGSFLNVVIYRLPIMMERDWKEQCEALLSGQSPCFTPPKTETFNLNSPRSRCPSCGHMITALENIPILSFIWLKGKCSHCQTPISLRYPIIEFITALLCVVVAWKFGFSWQTLGGILLTCALICLTMIDFDKMLLPDEITLSFLWLGILFNTFNVYTDLESCVIGAMLGYLSLWSVYHAFRILTGKEGMGYGDFKLLALFGAWMGWKPLLLIIILSSFVGAVIGLTLVMVLGRDKNIPIPFGPYLAAAGWITLIWGDAIMAIYLQWSGLT